uniref:LysR family transcriptional regulator n=1 Tax=Pantoea sp. IMH TaxID=1267600 RepID=UPI0004B7BB44|nr:LysR family transcriptional regulator [Pantoea sp. IMH]
MAQKMDWNDLRFFLTVARTQSLTKTAEALRVSQSTVSRRIGMIETALSVRLFIHHQSGYFLTDAGRDLMRYAEEVEEKVLQLESDIAGYDRHPTGTVRLATASTLASHLIIPALPRFAARFPGITLEIITGVNTVSVSRHDADLALRLIRPVQQTLKIRRAGCIRSAIYGSEAYLRQHPAPEAEPLSGRRFISWDTAYAHLPAARWLSETCPKHTPALVVTSLDSHIAAVRAALGLAVLPCFIASHYPELTEVLPAEKVFAEDIWLVSHADLTASTRVRAVSDFLLEMLSEAQLR